MKICIMYKSGNSITIECEKAEPRMVDGRKTGLVITKSKSNPILLGEKEIEAVWEVTE